MAEAQQKVAQATQQMSEQRGASQAASALGEAAESLNRAAASLARDRERVNSSSSASGFAEMLQQLQEMAKKQGSINAQAQGLLPMPGGNGVAFAPTPPIALDDTSSLDTAKDWVLEAKQRTARHGRRLCRRDLGHRLERDGRAHLHSPWRTKLRILPGLSRPMGST